MKMKKTIAGMVMAVSVLFSVAGCGAKEASKPLGEITKAVLDSGIDFPEMVEVSEDNFGFKYDIDAEDYSEFSVYWAGSGGDSDEVCIIKAKEGKADSVKEDVQERLNSQKDVFKDYVPEEYDKLCKSEVKTEGDYVYWVCTDDNSKAEETLLSYFE